MGTLMKASASLTGLRKLRKPQNRVKVKFESMIHPQMNRKFREVIS